MALTTREQFRESLVAAKKAQIMLRQVYDGSGKPTAPGRFTVAEIDSQLVTLRAALGGSTGPGNVAPSFSADPVIIGTPTEGAASAFTPGTVSGTPTPTRTNDWLVDDVVVASTATYTPGAGAAGKTLKVRDNASNVAGSVSRTSSGIIIVASGGVDDYQLWLNNLAAAGGDASQTEKDAVAAFINTAKTGANAFWNLILRANAFVNNAGGSLVPFKRNGASNDTSPAATDVNAGGRGNTSGTGYVNTQTPAPGAVGGLSVYLRDIQSFAPAAANVVIGARDAAQSQAFRIAGNIRSDGTAVAGYVSGAWGGAAAAQMESNLGAAMQVGHWHVHRSSSTSLKLRRNGTLVGAEFVTNTTATPISENIFVFGQNGGGTAGAFTKTPTSIGYYAILSGAMTDAQAAAYNTAVVAMMTAMGRNL